MLPMLSPSHPQLSSTHTLVEFPVSATGHGWVIPPIHFCYMVAFNVGQFIHCQIPSKRNLVTES